MKIYICNVCFHHNQQAAKIQKKWSSRESSEPMEEPESSQKPSWVPQGNPGEWM